MLIILKNYRVISVNFTFNEPSPILTCMETLYMTVYSYSKVCQHAKQLCDNLLLTVALNIQGVQIFMVFIKIYPRATSYIAYLTNLPYPMILPNTYQSTVASYVTITFKLQSSCYNHVFVKTNKSKIFPPISLFVSIHKSCMLYIQQLHTQSELASGMCCTVASYSNINVILDRVVQR